MRLKDKVTKLEKQVRYLEQVLLCTEKFIEQYLTENKENLSLDHRFSTDSAMEEIYCLIKSVDGRLKKLESKSVKKHKKENNKIGE